MRTIERRRAMDWLKQAISSQKKSHSAISPYQKWLVKLTAEEIKYEMRQERKAS